jgi:WD40 repeat protein
LPSLNRLLRWGPRVLELINTETRQVIDSLTFKSHLGVRVPDEGLRVYAGWEDGVATIDCSHDKLSRVAELEIPKGLVNFGVTDTSGQTFFVSSRSEGERTGAYRGRVSAWNTSTKKPIWLLETSSLNPLWREVNSLSLHPNGETLACCVTETEMIIGKKHTSASYVVLVNTGDGAVKQYIKAHRNASGPVSFSPDGSRILTVSPHESAMKLWATL